MKRFIGTFVTSLILGGAAFADTCSLPLEDFPKFGGASVIVSEFTGRTCSIDDYRKQINTVSSQRNDVAVFEEARVVHDFLVREFDRRVEIAAANGTCSGDGYETLKSQIRTANFLNQGPRKSLWSQNQRKIDKEINSAKDNIKRLLANPGGQCTDNS